MLTSNAYYSNIIQVMKSLGLRNGCWSSAWMKKFAFLWERIVLFSKIKQHLVLVYVRENIVNF